MFTFNATAEGDIDGLGRLVSGSETLVGADGSDVTCDLDYSYDGLGQLLSVDIGNIAGSDWWADYSYAKDGNISSRTINSNTVNFEYDLDDDDVDDCDYMTKIGDDSLVWDENGRLTTSVTSSLAYNWDGKLRSATSGDDSIALKYDPLGNRVYKESTVSSVTTKRKFIVDIASKLPTILIEIEPDTSSLKKSYIYTRSLVLVQREYEANPSYYDDYFYLHDRLGSVRMIVDPDTAVVATYTYNPFGSDFATEVSETIDNPFKFTGQWYDSETGQYFLRARDYAPQLMRMTSIDPVKGKQYMPLTIHPYLYCGNEPVNRTDPTGRFFGLGEVLFANALSNNLRTTHAKTMYGIHNKAMGSLDAFSTANLTRGVTYDLLVADYDGGLKSTLIEGGIAALGLFSPNLATLASFGNELYKDKDVITGILTDSSWSGLGDYTKDELEDIFTDPGTYTGS